MIKPIITVISCNYRGGCTISLFQLSVWCEKCVAARRYAVIWKQLLFTNKRNRVRWVVLGLSQDGACTDLPENFSEDSWKGDLSNDNVVSPPLFSLVNTFKDKNIFIVKPEKNICGTRLDTVVVRRKYFFFYRNKWCSDGWVAAGLASQTPWNQR